MSDISVLEKLQDTNNGLEIWWDSSPLIFQSWSKKILNSAPDETKRNVWKKQISRFFDVNNSTKPLVRGITTNPSLITKMILNESKPWSKAICQAISRQDNPDIESTLRLIYKEALRVAASAMMPKWIESNGKHGWVSGQLDPRYVFDVDMMMEQALQISRLSPNLMIKVPGSREGYEVIRKLVSRGISINNTFSYTIPQFMKCISAIEAGLAEARCKGVDVSRCQSVVTYMIGRFGAQGDLLEEAAMRNIPLTQTDIRWAEVAILKRIYAKIQKNGHPVKMLLSSLQVDDSKRKSETSTLSMHLEQTAGANIVYTCNPKFIADLMHRESELREFDPNAIHREIPSNVMEKLMQLPYFINAYEPDGMTPDEFAYHGAFLSTLTEVNREYRRLIDFIAQHFQFLSKSDDNPLRNLENGNFAAENKFWTKLSNDFNEHYFCH